MGKGMPGAPGMPGISGGHGRPGPAGPAGIGIDSPEYFRLYKAALRRRLLNGISGNGDARSTTALSIKLNSILKTKLYEVCKPGCYPARNPIFSSYPSPNPVCKPADIPRPIYPTQRPTMVPRPTPRPTTPTTVYVAEPTEAFTDEPDFDGRSDSDNDGWDSAWGEADNSVSESESDWPTDSSDSFEWSRRKRVDEPLKLGKTTKVRRVKTG